MLRLIYRQFLLDRASTVLTVLAIGAVISVILVLDGFQAGLDDQQRRAVLERSADLMVAQAGVSNFIGARSSVPQLSRSDVEAVEGVQQAHPLTAISTIYEQEGKRTPIYLVVFDSLGGPTELIAGAEPSDPRDIVIDRGLALRYDLGPGDPLVLSDFRFVVSGVSTGTSAFFTPFAFIRYDDLIDLYLESDLGADLLTFPMLSFLLVELMPGSDSAAVAAAIEAGVPEVDVLTPEALARNDVTLGRTLVGPVLRLLLGVGYAIGGLVVTIVMFASVHARVRSLGLLKALGFSVPTIARAVLVETTARIALAIPIGLLLAAGLARLIESLAPIYSVLPFETSGLVRTTVAALVFALLGAATPVRLIARADPAEVFRS